MVYEYIPIDLKPISLKKQSEILKAELTTVYNILTTEIDNTTLSTLLLKEEKNQNMKIDYCY